MTGYELEIDQLRRAARATRSAGDQLAVMDVSCQIGGGVGALPGSRSGERLRTLEDSWGRAGRQYSGRLIDHATKLEWAAGDYTVDDAKAAEVFDRPRVGGQQEY